MSFYDKECSSCHGRIYVTFPLKDGSESRQTRIARGAVQVEFRMKKATHSADHVQIRRTFCVHCAANGLVEIWAELRGQLLDPNGNDPDRVLRPRVRHENGDESETTNIRSKLDALVASWDGEGPEPW